MYAHTHTSKLQHQHETCEEYQQSLAGARGENKRIQADILLSLH